LVRRCRAGKATGARENQALVAVLSTQLWHHQFLDGRAARARSCPPLSLEGADVALFAESAVAH